MQLAYSFVAVCDFADERFRGVQTLQSRIFLAVTELDGLVQCLLDVFGVGEECGLFFQCLLFAVGEGGLCQLVVQELVVVVVLAVLLFGSSELF